MRNLIRAGDEMVNGQRLDDAYLAPAMDRAEQIRPWHEALAEASAANGRLRGVAIVPLTWITNPGPSGATVKLEDDGTATVICAAAEIGTGAVATGIRQIVADELGLRFEDIRVSPTDTDTGGYDNGAQGSRTIFGMGNAVLDASIKIREQIIESAADLLEAAPTDLTLAAGSVQVVGDPDKSVSLASVAGKASVDVRQLYYSGYQEFMFSDWGGATRSFNLDGLVVYPGRDTADIAYTQIFRTGAMEAARYAGELYMEDERDKMAVPSGVLSGLIRDALVKFLAAAARYGRAWLRTGEAFGAFFGRERVLFNKR